MLSSLAIGGGSDGRRSVRTRRRHVGAASHRVFCGVWDLVGLRSEAATLVESDLTGERVIVGTPAYMSPEQASGRPVDKRADIWAFGCCLYQTLTGKRPFHGSNATELLADIIKGEPDWNALPKQTPGRVRILLWRCLQKDPRRRLRDIGEAVFEIAETSTDPSGTLHSRGMPADAHRGPRCH